MRRKPKHYQGFEALYYTAKLRLPPDTKNDEIKKMELRLIDIALRRYWQN